jgi:hypothetical protein
VKTFIVYAELISRQQFFQGFIETPFLGVGQRRKKPAFRGVLHIAEYEGRFMAENFASARKPEIEKARAPVEVKPVAARPQHGRKLP